MATKAELCIEIYKQLVEQHGDAHKVVRAEFIKRAVSEASCTPAGAATYYANCKNRGGATGETRVRVEGTSATPYGFDAGDKPDDRQLYSAVQPNKQGEVAAVAAYYNPTDAIARAKKVRGVAVIGCPQIGESIYDQTCFLEEAIQDGVVADGHTYVMTKP